MFGGKKKEGSKSKGLSLYDNSLQLINNPFVMVMDQNQQIHWRGNRVRSRGGGPAFWKFVILFMSNPLVAVMDQNQKSQLHSATSAISILQRCQLWKQFKNHSAPSNIFKYADSLFVCWMVYLNWSGLKNYPEVFSWLFLKIFKAAVSESFVQTLRCAFLRFYIWSILV